MDDYKLYNIAYKHLLCCIHCGFYPSGSKLPPVPELCSSFQVSRSTIHSALRMLQDEQYVSLSQGRSAIVTYDVQNEACRVRHISYCQSTKDALLDLNGIIGLIWPEVILQGLKLCGEQELKELEEIVDRMTKCAEYPFLEFFCRILARLGNPLLLNLYLSMLLFGHCTATHLGDEAFREGYMIQLRETSLRLLDLRRTGNDAELKALLIRNYRRRVEAVRLFCEVIPDPSVPAERLPYRWNYYTERPSVGFGLAMKLLREIYAFYHPMDFLPSVAALSKQYLIPIITVRRAIQILCDIGVVETVNGKGTRVIVGTGTPVQASRLSTPNMKKVLLPYLQSVQLILIVCKDVARAVFPTLPDGAVETAAVWLRKILASEDYHQTFSAGFKLLLEGAQSPALREILDGLMHFQYLGYPLRDLEPSGLRYDPRSTKALLKSLEDLDAELFAEEFQRLVADNFRSAKEKLLSGGITEAEAIVMPLL